MSRKYVGIYVGISVRWERMHCEGHPSAGLFGWNVTQEIHNVVGRICCLDDFCLWSTEETDMAKGDGSDDDDNDENKNTLQINSMKD